MGIYIRSLGVMRVNTMITCGSNDVIITIQGSGAHNFNNFRAKYFVRQIITLPFTTVDFVMTVILSEVISYIMSNGFSKLLK